MVQHDPTYSWEEGHETSARWCTRVKQTERSRSNQDPPRVKNGGAAGSWPNLRRKLCDQRGHVTDGLIFGLRARALSIGRALESWLLLDADP